MSRNRGVQTDTEKVGGEQKFFQCGNFEKFQKIRENESHICSNSKTLPLTKTLL